MYGCRWSAIAVHLPGRSDNEIKNHWHTALKKRGNNSSEGSKKCNNKNGGSNTKRKSSVENKRASDPNNNMHKNLVLESSSEELSILDYQEDIFQEELALDEITSGSFWTQPFQVESKIEFVAPSIDDYGLVCPPSPFHEFLSSFDFNQCDNYW